MAYPLSYIPKLAGRGVLFDANAILYNFWPTGRSNWEKDYSRAFSQLLRHGNSLLISYTVISEVVNRAIRIEHQHFNQQSKRLVPFKDYRNSSDGQEVLNEIYDILRESVLPRFNIVDLILTNAEIEAFLDVDTLDFNDKYLVKLCQEHQLILLTNDGDFAQSGIDILTSNPKLLI